ncbi:hypothetical protein [Oceanobacillus jeddahense]|uniref:Uncharacterized protein n=1 Tax=Oceanobacillus jeddahense TaxID=1462527 RepID=A0ABY5JSZ7_9BACI|nr:hypothetical protein [Oceanobacillus jeddahense]UUI03453.1 hypothetical protein NP439_01730 [Oceanobacillus jeddahense]
MKKLFLFILLWFSLCACDQLETNEPETDPVDSIASMPENIPDDFDFSVQSEAMKL